MEKLSLRGKKILNVLEADMDQFMNRISRRFEDVVLVYSRERRRDHFAEIFRNKFDDAKIDELSELPIDLVTLMFHFYDSADDLLWYLRHTEDLPLTLQQNFEASRVALKRLHLEIKQLTYAYREHSKRGLEIVSA